LELADNFHYIDPNVIQSIWEKEGGNDYIKMNHVHKCFINEPCDWQFTYTNEALEFGTSSFYLIPYSAGMLPILDPADTATSTVQIDRRGFSRIDHFTVQNNIPITPTEYCVYFQQQDGTITSGDRIYCGYFLEFVEDDFLDDLLAEYNCSTICSDIASSTDWTGGFWYGLECGARKVGCWALVPSKSSVQKFSNATQQLDSVFPFSLVADVQDIFTGYSTSTMGTITLDPMFPGDQSGVVLLSDTTISSKLGSVWTTLYNTMENAMYFLTFCYFVMYFIEIGKGTEDYVIDRDELRIGRTLTRKKYNQRV